jgi:hypothetical protein
MSDGVMGPVQYKLPGMNKLTNAHVAEALTSLKEGRTPYETYLLLVQAFPGGDDKRTGVMNGPCVNDLHGAVKLGGQHGSRHARIEGETGRRTKN